MSESAEQPASRNRTMTYRGVTFEVELLGITSEEVMNEEKKPIWTRFTISFGAVERDTLRG